MLGFGDVRAVKARWMFVVRDRLALDTKLFALHQAGVRPHDDEDGAGLEIDVPGEHRAQ